MVSWSDIALVTMIVAMIMMFVRQQREAEENRMAARGAQAQAAHGAAHGAKAGDDIVEEFEQDVFEADIADEHGPMEEAQACPRCGVFRAQGFESPCARGDCPARG